MLDWTSSNDMKIIHPGVYQKQRELLNRKRRVRHRVIALFTCVLLLAPYSYMVLNVQPVLAVNAQTITWQGEDVTLGWPVEGSASVGFVGSEGVATNFNGTVPRPSASTIKLLTALVILERQPLGVNEPGPSISFDAQDEALYRAVVAMDGSSYPVKDGMVMSYRQSLEAVLVVSANNIADKLARWAYGDLESYLSVANSYAKRIGLTQTVVADASGLSPQSVVSSNDLVLIAQKALEQPLLRSVVNTKSIFLPSGQEVKNTNMLLGTNSVSGMKTGYTPEAGACLVLSKDIEVSGKIFTLIAVVLGQPDRETVARTSELLITQFASYFKTYSVLEKGGVVGTISTPWGGSVSIKSSQKVELTDYVGRSMSYIPVFEPINSALLAGDIVGYVRVEGISRPLVIDADIPKAPLSWRVRHGIDYFSL